MNMLKIYMNRLNQINCLIKMKCTGNPREFAKKLEMSERRLFQCIDFLKNELNAPIMYNEMRQTYYYKESGEVLLNWFSFNKKKIKNKEIKENLS